MKKIDCYIIDAKNMLYTKTTIDDNLETFYDIIKTDSIQIITRKIKFK